MSPEPSNPAPVDRGFPNPLAEHYEGDRTPEEEHKFRQEQERRRAVGEAGRDSGEAETAERPPSNPYGTAGAAY